MTPQKSKEEFPIIRVLKDGVSVQVIQDIGTIAQFLIRRGESIISVRVNSRGRVIELTNNGKVDRGIWTMLKKALKRGDKFCWTNYGLDEDK